VGIPLGNNGQWPPSASWIDLRRLFSPAASVALSTSNPAKWDKYIPIAEAFWSHCSRRVKSLLGVKSDVVRSIVSAIFLDVAKRLDCCCSKSRRSSVARGVQAFACGLVTVEKTQPVVIFIACYRSHFI
jgi:hypothetical protein